ncbi:hypothetical protein LCGC14_2162620 [marine sediment metagenome]|uniref:Uncharacterized protein n=1 Tax=marine sediment metagenome TaxID=412755 RepID=A0A0F9G513_9ZZZZ
MDISSSRALTFPCELESKFSFLLRCIHHFGGIHDQHSETFRGFLNILLRLKHGFVRIKINLFVKTLANVCYITN